MTGPFPVGGLRAHVGPESILPEKHFSHPPRGLGHVILLCEGLRLLATFNFWTVFVLVEGLRLLVCWWVGVVWEQDPGERLRALGGSIFWIRLVASYSDRIISGF